MARVSKTSPFQPKPNTESEKKDEEKSNSSSSTSSANSHQNTQDKKHEKAKGKKHMQAKNRKRKTPLYETINGLLRVKGTVTKRGRGRGRGWGWGGGRGKPMAYTARLWGKNHPRINVHISSYDEPNNVDPKPKSTKDDMQEKIKGKRPMQAEGRGRGKPMAYTARLWSEHNRRLSSKRSNIDDLEVKVDKEEEVVFLSSDTDSDEVCKRINIRKHNDDDTDNNGQGTGTYTNLTIVGVEVVGK